MALVWKGSHQNLGGFQVERAFVTDETHEDENSVSSKTYACIQAEKLRKVL